jgi:hypothetical protein
MKLVLVSAIMLFGVCFLVSPAQAGNCPSFCAEIPRDRWNEVPPCRSCVEHPPAPQCEVWCENVPSDIWKTIPSCAGCRGSMVFPGCADWCRYIPEPYRRKTYGCYEC